MMRQSLPSGSPQEARHRRRVLLACVSGSFLTPFAASSTIVALPDIGRDLHLDAMMLGWITTSYLLVTTVTMLPAGRLADIHGRRRIFFSGLIVFSTASLICGAASSVGILIAARSLQGLGAGMFSSATVALLTSSYPRSERGRVLGIILASVFVGQAAGPVVGGILTGAFGWRSTFFAVPLVSLSTTMLSVSGLGRRTEESHPESFDVKGTLAYAAISASLVYGLSTVPSGPSILLLIASTVAIGLFLRLERRVQNPLLHSHLFRNQMFSRSSLAALSFFTTALSVPFILSLYLQLVEDISPEATGLILLSQPIIQAAFSPLMGRMSDRFEPRILATIGIGLTSLGVLALTLIGDRVPLAFILGVLAFLGVARALFSSPNANAIMSAVDQRFHGTASGTLGTVRVAGQMLGIGLVTGILGASTEASTITPAVHDTFLSSARLSFVLLAAICFCGTLASMSRGSLGRDEELLKSHS